MNDGEEKMIENETMRSILARRSYKMFDSRPIDDEALGTIVTAGLYAPTFPKCGGSDAS